MKNIIHGQEADLTSLNHIIYAPAVISTELCNVNIKGSKEMFQKNVLGRKKHLNLNITFRNK